MDFDLRSDNATTSPHQSDTGVVELPVVLLSSFTHEHESLRVRDDLGGVEGLFEVIDELLLVSLEWGDLRATKDFGGSDTLSLQAGQASSEYSLSNQGDWLSEIQSVDGGPLAGTFLACSVQDLGDEGLAVLVVVAEDIAGDLDEERVQDSLVPSLEDVGDLRLFHAENGLHDVVGFANELHITVLDTVVDHLDVVT